MLKKSVTHQVVGQLAAGALVLFLGFGSHTAYAATTDQARLAAELTDLQETMTFIQANYKDTISYEKLVDGAYQGIFDQLDPFSVYYKNSDEMTQVIETISGEYSGTGLTVNIGDGECLVKEVSPGTVAEKAGIKAGSSIIAIDGKVISTMKKQEISDLLHGEVGTKMQLEVQEKAGAVAEKISLTRENIKATSVYQRMLEHQVGYVQISSFDSDTDQELKQALSKLTTQGMTGLVIDLRDNGGGLVDSALKAAELLVPAGPLMYYEQQGKIVEEMTSKSQGLSGVPVAVLINDQTASASEIFAGAVQDRQVGVLVGTTSYGKGTAQVIQSINADKGMKLSVDYFLTPNKHKIHGVGLKPDYLVYNDLDKLRVKVSNFVPFDESSKPKAGEEGRNVYAAQERLALLGYDVQRNGVMDEKTVAAVNVFQANNGLAPYGTVDNITKMCLDDAVLLKCYFSDALVVDHQLNKAVELVQK